MKSLAGSERQHATVATDAAYNAAEAAPTPGRSSLAGALRYDAAGASGREATPAPAITGYWGYTF